jgi:hypothetical protein
MGTHARALPALVAYRRGVFEDAVQRATMAQALSLQARVLVQDTRLAFEALAKDAGAADGGSRSSMRERAFSLDSRRAYLLPAADIAAQATQMLADLRLWGVPSAIVADLKATVDDRLGSALKSDRLEMARAEFKVVVESYEYWDRYSDDFNANVRYAAVALALLGAGALIASSYLLFHQRCAFPGFVCAGAAGACVSILLRLPTLAAYGDAAPVAAKTIARFMAGVCAAAVGYGLFASGVFQISLGPKLTTADVITLCADGTATCTNTSLAVLLALAFLLGFSERALASFDGLLNRTLDAGAAGDIKNSGPRASVTAEGRQPSGQARLRAPGVPAPGLALPEADADGTLPGAPPSPSAP